MSDLEYRTVIKNGQKEIEIKKSRFIGHVSNCESEEEAIAFIEKIRKNHRQANHNCYAYIIGPNKLTQRYSDDGEPQGTAGIPMLEVLKAEELTNICLVVTRYFGGVKLGASGLIRAYTKSVTSALDEVDLVWMKKYLKISLDIDYTLLGKVENYLLINDLYEINREYTDRVLFNLYIRNEKWILFQEDIIEMTSANCKLEIVEELLLAEKDSKIIGG